MASLFSLLNRFNLVKNIPVFHNLNWLQLRRVAKRSIVEEYKKGDIIRREGDPPDYFYCLISGRLQSYSLNVSDIKENLEYIHRGMNFGVISTFTGESHSSTYEAINDSVVLKIPKDDFHAILKSIPELAIELSQSLSRRIRSHVKGARSNFESTIISIYSPVQSAGSSTYAYNLALSLFKETKKKVILVKIHADQGLDDDGDKKSSNDSRAFDLRDILGAHEGIFKNIIKEDPLLMC